MKKYTFEVLELVKGKQVKIDTIIIESELTENEVGFYIAEVFDVNPASLKLIEFKEILIAGRPKVIEFDVIQKYKMQGKTQEYIAKALNISLSTVRRNWK